MSDLLRLANLIVELPTAAGWVKPVNEVSLHIKAGETLGLVGESGSGRTILSLASTETSAKSLTSLSEPDGALCAVPRLP